MTDRFHSLVVVLDKNIRADDAEAIISAIQQLRGVLSVTGEVADSTAYMAEQRARSDLGQKILKVIFPEVGER